MSRGSPVLAWRRRGSPLTPHIPVCQGSRRLPAFVTHRLPTFHAASARGAGYDAQMKQLTALCVLLMLSGCTHKEPEPIVQKPPATVEDQISVYFSPHGGGMAAILKNINEARSSIDAAAYLITARDIVNALKAAHDRGVRIRIVLDKHNLGETGPSKALFANSGIGVWLDGKHKDVHDKYMLIDGKIVITGSFNFIDESEETNAENLLIIRDKPKLFAAYEANFEEHLHHSDPPE